MSQNQMILQHLKNNVGITQKDAVDLYGIYRLSGRIYELRQLGYVIDDVWRTELNRFGVETRFVEYRLREVA